MAQFKSDYASVAHGDKQFDAVDGVIEIPDTDVPAFADFIANGMLVAIETEPADETATKKTKGQKGNLTPGS
jgi:hypothetical protein